MAYLKIMNRVECYMLQILHIGQRKVFKISITKQTPGTRYKGTKKGHLIRSPF